MRSAPLRVSAAAVALALIGLGCRSAEPGSTGPASPPGFATPEAAFEALADAARRDPTGTGALLDVLGLESAALLDAGDPVQLRNEIESFLALYDERHATERQPDGSVTLLAGDDDWPFPVPLVRADGGWRFDTERGLQEVADRRVGRNELHAIRVCRAIVDAQEDYRALDPEGSGGYAARFASEPGRRDGLHWPVEAGAPRSPLGELVAAAAAEGYRREAGAPAAYHGYRYRILTERGPWAPGGAGSYLADGRLSGFAVVAWPAEHGASGITTFLVDRSGIVYERDLGERTEEIASSMRAFDPDPEWTVCQD